MGLSKLKFLLSIMMIFFSCVSISEGEQEEAAQQSVTVLNGERGLYTENRDSWDKRVDDEGEFLSIEKIYVDKEDNVYVLCQGGDLVSEDSGYDWHIIKYSDEGEVLWRRSFDGNRGADPIGSMTFDSKGNLLIMGYGQNLVSENGSFDIWLKKLDSEGREIRDWVFPGNNSRYAPLTQSIAVDEADNLYVLSCYNNHSHEEGNSSDWLLQKISSTSETVLWREVIGSGRGFDWPLSLVTDRKGHVYVAGIGDNIVEGVVKKYEPLDYDWWLKKYSYDGSEDVLNWDKKIDGNGNWDWPAVILYDESGYIYVCGFGSDLVAEKSSYDWWIKKFTPDGREIIENWDKITGLDHVQDYIDDALLDKHNNLIIGGTTHFDNKEGWNITRISSDGRDITDLAIFRNITDEKYSLSGIAINSRGEIYAAGSIYIEKGEEFTYKGFIKRYEP